MILKTKNIRNSALRCGISKTLLGLTLVGLSTTAFASLEDCLNLKNLQGNNDSEKIIKYCEPYAEKNIYATGALSGAYTSVDDRLAIKYGQWAINYYTEHKLNSVDDKDTINSVYGLLGDIYYFGSKDVAEGAKPIPADPKKGLAYTLKAAELGNAIAQAQLGGLYSTNKNAEVKQNVATAYKWLKIGTLNGSSKARNDIILSNIDIFIRDTPYCIAMGEQLVAQAYLDGTGGLPKDNATAKSYLEKAIALYKDNKPTKENLKYCPEGADKLNLDSAEKLLESL